MLDKRQAVALKIEASEGTAETLTAAQVIYAENIKFTPNVEALKRNPHLASISPEPPLPGRSYAKISFDCPMYGGSATGTAPYWGAALQGCGFAETLNAGYVKYLPQTATIAAALKSVTIKYFRDGSSFRMVGCRGTVSRKNSPGDVPRLSFEFTGIWNPSVDADAYKDEAFLAGNAFPSFNPLPFSAALFSVNDGSAYYAVTKAISWDIKNTIALEPSANVTDYKSVQITGRNPTFSFDAEAVTMATKDFFRLMGNKTAFQVQGFTGSLDSGTAGTGAAGTMTDATKNWNANQWNTFKLMDKNYASYPISANSATVLTVTGTPATGLYSIYTAGQLIRETLPKIAIDSVNGSSESGILWQDIPCTVGRSATDDELEIYII